MEKFDYYAKMFGFLGNVLAIFLICFIAYGGYLFYVYKTMPGMKAKVSGLYQLFSGGQAFLRPAAADTSTAPNKGWTTINTRTSDETLESLSSMSDTEVKEKLNEVKDYEKLLNGNSLKLLKLIVGVVSKNKDGTVISGEDEKQIKAMLEKVIDDYQHNRIQGMDEVEKETGKW